MESVQRFVNDRKNVYIALAAAPAIGILAAKLLQLLASRKSSPSRLSIYRAPERHTSIGRKDDEDLPYPPKALPGSRDIETPFGVTRAYEFGPEDGRKVLLVHGISTPCLSMASLAKLLSQHGFRVCCYDVFGRGYSDAPDPSSHRQDFALFSSQIFSVITSSPLDWAGDGFILVGYSLGGGIATCFTSYFPNLVRGLVLLAPGGLIRPSRMTLVSRILYGSYLPTAVVEMLVRCRMKRYGSEPQMNPQAIDVTSTVTDETPGTDVTQDGWLNLFDGVRVCPDKAVEWQLDSHPGFVPSFVSSLRHGPIYDCHERLRIIGRRCNTASGRLIKEKVLVILGKQDSVILAHETAEDIGDSLGRENAEIVLLPGGHDLPIANAMSCVKAMIDFWAST